VKFVSARFSGKRRTMKIDAGLCEEGSDELSIVVTIGLRHAIPRAGGVSPSCERDDRQNTDRFCPIVGRQRCGEDDIFCHG
jgi:hypothetical protein